MVNAVNLETKIKDTKNKRYPLQRGYLLRLKLQEMYCGYLQQI